MTRMIALLRAVNVGTRKLPMAELREIAEELGFADAQTYVASGNLVFAARGHDPAEAAALLEAAIADRYGWTSEVVLRMAEQWAVYAGGSAFPDAQRDRPNMLHLLLSRRPPMADAAARIADRAADGERVAIVGDAIWIDFLRGVGRSKLTPAFLNRCIGSPATARNWNTVVKLDAMARA